MTTVNIGKLAIKGNVFLSPMAAVTNLPYRMLCRKYGASLCYTEMVAAFPFLHSPKAKENELLRTVPEDKLLGCQLMSPTTIAMQKALSVLDEQKDAYSFYDLNVGCPAHKITKREAGGALLKKPELVGTIIKTMHESTPKPVTVKIRTGWNKHDKAVVIAKIAEKAGADAITVHGRTVEMHYSGVPNYEIIREVKQAVSIPVIVNGNVDSPESAKRILEITGGDAVMIGRAAIGNPLLFQRIQTYLDTGDLLPEPTPAEKLSVWFEMEKMVERYSSLQLYEKKFYACWFAKSLPAGPQLRQKIAQAQTIEELHDVINGYLAEYDRRQALKVGVNA